MATKCIIPILLFLALTALAQGQSPFHEMIAAENAFASLSRSTNTRDAFLANLNDSTVLFEEGGPVRGRESWKARPVNETLLFWWPVFAGIASDGRMGFTTGPWEWSPKKDASPAGFGFFASIWKKSERGWSLAADIGVAFDKKFVTDSLEHAIVGKPAPASTPLREADASYIKLLNTDGKSFDDSYFSNDGMILRSGVPPQTGSAIRNFKDHQATGSFIQSGCEVSRSNDLGYCFGTVKTAGEKNTDERIQKSFLRVYKTDQLGNWKIVLDVIGGN